MEGLAKIVALIRDLVWTVLGVVLLLAVAFLLTGGATQLLPAGAGSGSGSGGGQGNGQPGGSGAQPPGPNGGGGGGAQPGGTQGGGGQQPPGPGQGGSLSVTGSGAFAGSLQGKNATGSVNVQATMGGSAKGVVNFMLSFGGAQQISFSGNVTCLIPTGTNPGRAIVGGTINQSNDATRMPAGSGFVVGVVDGSPDQVSPEMGFNVTDPTAICSNEAGNLFSANHPGFNLTSGDISIH